MIRKELSQGQVALAAGLTQPVISHLVTGLTKDPPISTVIKLSALPGLPLDVLLSGIEAKSLVPRRDRKSQVARLKRLLDALEKGNHDD